MTGQAADERRIKILLDGNKLSVSVFLTQVSPVFPVLAGGYIPGDVVLFVADKKAKFANGDQLYKGLDGEVVGKSSMGDGTDDRRVKVLFTDNTGPINVFLTEIAPLPSVQEEIQSRGQRTADELVALEAERVNQAKQKL